MWDHDVLSDDYACEARVTLGDITDPRLHFECGSDDFPTAHSMPDFEPKREPGESDEAVSHQLLLGIQ